MMIRYVFFSFLLFITSQASAELPTEKYAIHLDTSKSSNINEFKALSFYGDLYTVKATDGYLSTLLGPYTGKQVAREVLNKVRVSGYYSAFLMKHNDIQSPISVISHHQPSEEFMKESSDF